MTVAACRYTNPKYPVHFIVGGAGCDEMGGKTAPHNTTAAASPAWLAAADGSHYGMGILKFVNVWAACCAGVLRA